MLLYNIVQDSPLTPASLSKINQGMIHQQPFDIRRRDVFSSGCDDDLFFTPGDPEIAVVINPAQIAGINPSIIGDGFPGQLRLVEIAFENDVSPPRTIPLYIS